MVNIGSYYWPQWNDHCFCVLRSYEKICFRVAWTLELTILLFVSSYCVCQDKWVDSSWTHKWWIFIHFNSYYLAEMVSKFASLYGTQMFIVICTRTCMLILNRKLLKFLFYVVEFYLWTVCELRANVRWK